MINLKDKIKEILGFKRIPEPRDRYILITEEKDREVLIQFGNSNDSMANYKEVMDFAFRHAKKIIYSNPEITPKQASLYSEELKNLNYKPLTEVSEKLEGIINKIREESNKK